LIEAPIIIQLLNGAAPLKPNPHAAASHQKNAFKLIE